MSHDPIHIISLGGGVQSSTMAMLAANGILTPMPTCAVFADTQNEPPHVYSMLDWLEKRVPFPIHRITAGNLAEKELCLHVSKKSGATYRKGYICGFTLDQNGKKGKVNRKCTIDFKIRPIRSFERKQAGIFGKHCTDLRVIQWIGISTDEAAYRMHKSEEAWRENRWPLIEIRWSREDCKRYWKEQGLQEPKRSACFFCPLHSDVEWVRLKTEDPELFERAVALEKKMNEIAALERSSRRVQVFLHSSRKVLSEINFDDKSTKNEQLGLFNEECKGYCGV